MLPAYPLPIVKPIVDSVRTHSKTAQREPTQFAPPKPISLQIPQPAAGITPAITLAITPAIAPGVKASKPIKILVIENEDGVRENIVELLEAEGFDVVAAGNGRQGLQVAIAETPGLILCDILMPDLDGYQVLEFLRSQAAFAGIPFLFLSAKVSDGDRERGMALGATGYIPKPFTLNQLLDAIQSCCPH